MQFFFFVKETGLQVLIGVWVSESEVELGPVGAEFDQNKTIRTDLKTMKALQYNTTSDNIKFNRQNSKQMFCYVTSLQPEMLLPSMENNPQTK